MSFNPMPPQTVSQTLPLIALGGTYSFTVTFVGAAVGMAVVLNSTSTTLLGSLSSMSAYVSAANTVTIFLKSAIAVSAGAQAFVIAVIP